MSIIQEALKKARVDGREDHDLFDSSLSGRARSTKKDFKPSILFVMLFVISAGFVLRWLLPEGANKPTTEEPAHQETDYKPLNIKSATDETNTPPLDFAARARQLPPNLVLNGIMYLAERPQAIINNSVVGVGDTVSGAKVLSIDKASVLLSFNDMAITLTLKK